MANYITKKSDKGGSKAKEEYIAESNQPKEEKKIEYIKKKDKNISIHIKKVPKEDKKEDKKKIKNQNILRRKKFYSIIKERENL